MKLCGPCVKALGNGQERICLTCKRKLRELLSERGEGEQWPELWVPEPGEAVLIAGMSGMGKSTFEKAQAAHIMKEGVDFFAWDAMREMSVEGEDWEGAQKGPLHMQLTVSDLEGSPRDNLAYVQEGAKAGAIAIVPDKLFPDRSERAADFVRAMRLFIANKPRGNCVLLVTESGLLEGEAEAEEMLAEIATTWRKAGVSPIFDTQSAYGLPVRARDQVKTVVSFKQIGENDRRALKSLVSQRYSDAVSRLKPFCCLLADRMDLDAWSEDAPEKPGANAAA
jgi:DNA helicase HerA-like ATPase